MYENIVNSLRYCAENDCSPKCPRAGIGKGCIAGLKREAADAIEELQGRAKVLEKVADKWREAVPEWIPVRSGCRRSMLMSLDAATRAAEGEMNMGVYIKGMEMPKRGSIEIQIYADGRVTVNPIYACKRIVGRAVHVPPHGRCVDADKLMREMRLFIKENMISRDDARELLETIADAPTVLEAE